MSAAQDFKRFLQNHGDFEELCQEGETAYVIMHRFKDTGITVQVVYHFDSENCFAKCGISGFGKLNDSSAAYRLLNTLNERYIIGTFYRTDDGVVVARTGRSISDSGLDCQAFFDDSYLLLKTVEEAIKELMKFKFS